MPKLYQKHGTNADAQSGEILDCIMITKKSGWTTIDGGLAGCIHEQTKTHLERQLRTRRSNQVM